MPLQQAHRWAAEGVGTAADEVARLSRLDPEPCCATMGSSLVGLTVEEAARRLKSWGPNLIAREAKPSIPLELWGRAKNPLNALLITLAIVSYALGDVRAAVVIALMVMLAITTAFVQEHRCN
jgi:P-type Mg2+ transporter